MILLTRSVTQHRQRRSGGFTLVELLVTIAIIAIVTSFVLGALAMSQEAARESKTKGLVAQLHNRMMQKWESYRTRRVPISTTGLTRQQALDKRLLAIRELMRMEMPDRWKDVEDAQLILNSRPALSLAYNRIRMSKNPSPNNQEAECLYLILSAMRDDASRELVEKHSADTDSDGVPEIIDAWQKPIRWIRWPAGFLVGNGANTDLQTGDAVNDHDPFDPLKRELPDYDSSTGLPNPYSGPSVAYALVPLIYSAGPDGQYDIVSDRKPNALQYRSTSPTHNPYVGLTATEQVGQPFDLNGNGDLEHLDNIHNHNMGLTSR